MADGIDRLGPVSVQPRLPAHLDAPLAGRDPFPDVEGGERAEGDDRELSLAADDDGDPAARRRRDRVTISAEARRLYRGAARETAAAAEPTRTPPPSAERRLEHGGTLDVTA